MVEEGVSGRRMVKDNGRSLPSLTVSHPSWLALYCRRFLQLFLPSLGEPSQDEYEGNDN